MRDLNDMAVIDRDTGICPMCPVMQAKAASSTIPFLVTSVANPWSYSNAQRLRRAASGNKRRYTFELFHLARLLLHELAHAISTATRDDAVNCFFPDAAVGEDGLEPERRVF